MIFTVCKGRAFPGSAGLGLSLYRIIDKDKFCCNFVLFNIQVDIIVNTTGKNLDLRNGAVSASLLRAGGDSLQQELNKNYPKGLSDEEIAISSGGNLKCRNVLHGSLMNWDGGNKAVQVIAFGSLKC